MEVHLQSSRWIRRKVIGKGSYGVVSLGFRDGEVFAVKSAEKSSVSSIDALENEVEILCSLSSSSSPFIVDYYGNGETASCKSLFMEYVPGGDVARGGKVVDVELIRSYTWCLVMALMEVHRKKIVHCDVKGSNVLVGATNGVVKLADFGSSKRVGDDDQRLKMVPRGSPLWMAPEVVRGESQLYESDVWSLGCTVIEMFTGMPAWQDNGVHTLYKIGYSDDLPEYPARLPDPARDFLDKCLTREPGKRWRCDQLLQHPFLFPAPAGKIFEASPRSVFDLDNVDFSDEDDDDQIDHELEDDESDEVSVRGRIGNLATVSGVNWESDGWIEVRNVMNERDEDETIRSKPGVNSEFENVNDHTWINLCTENNEVEINGGADGGRGCYGSLLCRQVIKRVKKIAAVTMENLLLMIFMIIMSCYTSIGRAPNANIILLNKINTNTFLFFFLSHANFGEFPTLFCQSYG